MLDRIMHRTPRLGDRASVLSGPYAGRVGTITAISGEPPAYQVTIDDCCRPTLPASAIRARHRGPFEALSRAADRREPHSARGAVLNDPIIVPSLTMISDPLEDGESSAESAEDPAR